MAVVRVRQHVNPLSDKYQQSLVPPDWSSIYANPRLPLHLDIGCGKGVFLHRMATLTPEWNFLGLEIREPVVTQALIRRDQAGLNNLHFLFGNANCSLETLMASWESNPLQRVSIHFPDPWFKKRHQKRRVVQPELVAVLAKYLPSGGSIVLQSDVEEVARDMCDRITEHPAFERPDSQWLASSPFPVMTDREQVTLEQGKPVYRALYLRI